MDKEGLKHIVAQGLGAMQTGVDIAAHGTSEIQNQIQQSELRAAFQAGNQVSEQWRDRIVKALGAVGGGSGQENLIMQAHGQIGRKVIEEAPDDQARSLGIIAISQLALHYWIAAFGTMATYTKHLGLEEVAADMKKSADEAKQGDERFTELARSIVAG